MRTFKAACSRHVLAALAAVLLFSASPFARAATFVVTKTADTNDGTCDADCSLREAVIAANANPGADDITLPAGTYTLTIAGANEDAAATGDLDITDSVTINGAGAVTTIIDGGAIDRVFHVLAGTSAINDVTIRNGLAPGVSAGGGVLVVATLGLTNVTLIDNHTAGGAGGGILNNGTTTITNCTVSVNGSGGGVGGGGINNQNVMTISGATITGNTTGGGGSGAGVNNSADMTLSNSTITSNNAGGGGNGGGLFNSSTVSVDATTITGNAAGPSGGNGGGVYNSGTATITGGTIATNSTAGGGNGGGAFNSDTLTLTMTPVTGNTASGNGGGIYENGLLTALTDLTVSGNSAGAASDGGGLWAQGLEITLVGVTISGNTAGGNGGAIYDNALGVTLTNVTVNGNVSTGPTLYSWGATLDLVDSTIAGNTGGGITTLVGSTTTLKNTIIANNGTNCSGAGTTTDAGTNLQFPGTTCGLSIPTADPLLQALANNGGATMTMALTAGSPAIDTGTTGCPPTPATDQRGVSRPQGVACDIGAFELQGFGAPTPTPINTPIATATPIATTTPIATVTPIGTTTPIATVTTTPATTPIATPTPLPTGVPPATPTPPIKQVVAVPTLSWPVLAIFGLLLVAAALFFLQRQP
jgi:CSLREA domain-containing protein